MELNVWMNTKIYNAKYMDDVKSWTIEVKRGDNIRTFRPKHIVLCTGHSGEPKISSFPGQNDFKGKVYHGSQHQDASESGDVRGKKVVIIGTGILCHY